MKKYFKANIYNIQEKNILAKKINMKVKINYRSFYKFDKIKYITNNQVKFDIQYLKLKLMFVFFIIYTFVCNS